MLIKVFNQWISKELLTKIIAVTEMYGTTEVTISGLHNSIMFQDKTATEVVEEINKQIKGQENG